MINQPIMHSPLTFPHPHPPDLSQTHNSPPRIIHVQFDQSMRNRKKKKGKSLLGAVGGVIPLEAGEIGLCCCCCSLDVDDPPPPLAPIPPSMFSKSPVTGGELLLAIDDDENQLRMFSSRFGAATGAVTTPPLPLPISTDDGGDKSTRPYAWCGGDDDCC